MDSWDLHLGRSEKEFPNTMKRGVRDTFQTKAKQDKFLARSVYKLEQLDAKHQLFASLPAGTLVEFGISPGSWYQYYSRKISDSIFVVGIDMKPLKSSIKYGTWLEADILGLSAEQIKKQCQGTVVCVLSDALPNLTGNRLQDQSRIEALRDHITNLVFDLLRTGGTWVMKTFDCPSHKAWLDRCKRRFSHWGHEKPEASRKESPEVYFVGKGFHP
jgi:23S rRNA (uridine2552-2'-O)-methyltransferase